MRLRGVGHFGTFWDIPGNAEHSDVVRLGVAEQSFRDPSRTCPTEVGKPVWAVLGKRLFPARHRLNSTAVARAVLVQGLYSISRSEKGGKKIEELFGGF